MIEMNETFRGTMRARTPDREFTTVILTRQGLGNRGRVWLTLDGATKTTVVMTDPQTEELGALLDKARASQ